MLFSSRGWKNLFEVDASLYSPYYPFKDHDALCLTVKLAGFSSVIEVNQEEKDKSENQSFSTIYAGQTMIN